MKFGSIIAAVLGMGSLLGVGAATQPAAAPVRPVTTDYFGISVDDPYRYMENLADPEVADWIKAQGVYARGTLDSISGRDELLSEINKYSDAAPARVSSVWRLSGEKYFFLKTLAGESIAKLYFREGLQGKDVLIVDTDKFKGTKGEPAAINEFAPSQDGKYVACSISQGGAEVGVIHVFDVASDTETGEKIDRVWGADFCWREDNSSFFYHRLQKVSAGAEQNLELNSRAYLHVIGDLKDDDQVILGNEVSQRTSIDPIDWPGIHVQPGCDWGIGEVVRGVKIENRLYVAPKASLDRRNIPWNLLADFDDDVTDFALHGDEVYLLTHKDAERFKVVRTSLDHPDVANAEVVLPEQAGVLRSLSAAADALYVIELDGGIRHVIRIPWGGQAERVKLPVEGNVGVSADSQVAGVVMDIGSWIMGDRYYEYDPGTGAVMATDLQPLGPFDDPGDLVSMEVEAPSYDGTMVPLSIIMKKGTVADGNNPTELVGYGGYGITMDPGFDPRSLAWYERGGIVAIAHVRGGGEKGEEWHQAGKGLTKPNTWRDMIACAEYLIGQKWTSPSRLAAVGGSAGGITVGRSITERPDLFAAASIRAGVVNALRFEASANGPPNVPEFGSVSTQEGFEDVYAMDAYLHVRDGVAYPAVMLTIGMNDPRVTPWMSAKFAARLDAATSSGRPVLLRVDYANGHGIGASKKQLNEQIADTWAFFLWQFGEKGYERR